jgi:hypothetical protein
MTPSEHIVNVALRMKLRVDGEKLAFQRAQRQLKTTQEEIIDCKERILEAEAEYSALVKLMNNSNDPDIMLAFLSKL